MFVVRSARSRLVHRHRWVVDLAFVLFVAGVARGQTVLDPGDLGLVGIHCDDLSGSGGSPKAFAFVTFVAMEAGTVVNFTDNGWMSPEDVFRLGEGTASFTVSAGGLAAGSVITLPGVSGNFNLSTSGDQIFVFQGSIDGLSGAFTGTLLWGLNDEGAGVWQSTATSASDSALPAELASYSVALPELDNYAYSGPLSGTVSELQAAIRSGSNWTGDNTVQPQFPVEFDIEELPPIFEDGFESADTSAWSLRSPP